MPGRTAKSIEGQWTKVKTSLNTIKESMGLPVDVKATPRKSPGMTGLSETLPWAYKSILIPSHSQEKGSQVGSRR